MNHGDYNIWSRASTVRYDIYTVHIKTSFILYLYAKSMCNLRRAGVYRNFILTRDIIEFLLVAIKKIWIA